MVAMGTLGHERVGIATQLAILAADLRAMVTSARAVNPEALRRPGTARPHRPGLDRHRTGPTAVAACAVQDHQGGEELAGGPLRQAELVGPGPDARRPVGGPARPGRRARPRWSRRRRPGQVDPALLVPALQHHRRGLDGGAEEHHRGPGDRPPASLQPVLTWRSTHARRASSGSPVGRGATRSAPEPLDQWEDVARAAAADAACPAALTALDSLQVVFCQSWQYDDPAARLAGRLGARPGTSRYSGLGGSVPLQTGGRHRGRHGRGRDRPGPGRRAARRSPPSATTPTPRGPIRRPSRRRSP